MSARLKVKPDRWRRKEILKASSRCNAASGLQWNPFLLYTVAAVASCVHRDGTGWLLQQGIGSIVGLNTKEVSRRTSDRQFF
jgi:hypothetical protein